MNHALPATYFAHKGLVSRLGTHQRLQRLSWTAGCGTARPVVWEGGERKLTLYPIARAGCAECV